MGNLIYLFNQEFCELFDKRFSDISSFRRESFKNWKYFSSKLSYNEFRYYYFHRPIVLYRDSSGETSISKKNDSLTTHFYLQLDINRQGLIDSLYQTYKAHSNFFAHYVESYTDELVKLYQRLFVQHGFRETTKKNCIVKEFLCPNEPEEMLNEHCLYYPAYHLIAHEAAFEKAVVAVKYAELAKDKVSDGSVVTCSSYPLLPVLSDAQNRAEVVGLSQAAVPAVGMAMSVGASDRAADSFHVEKEQPKPSPGVTVSFASSGTSRHPSGLDGLVDRLASPPGGSASQPAQLRVAVPRGVPPLPQLPQQPRPTAAAQETVTSSGISILISTPAPEDSQAALPDVSGRAAPVVPPQSGGIVSSLYKINKQKRESEDSTGNRRVRFAETT